MAFCKKITDAARKIDSFVKAHLSEALLISSNIKKMLESPLAVLVTAIIPTDVDEALRIQLISALAKAIDVLTIIDACKDAVDFDQKLICFMGQLKKYSPEVQEALIQKLMSVVTRELDGNRFAQSLYDTWSQSWFLSNK